MRLPQRFSRIMSRKSREGSHEWRTQLRPFSDTEIKDHHLNPEEFHTQNLLHEIARLKSAIASSMVPGNRLASSSSVAASDKSSPCIPVLEKDVEEQIG